MRIYTRDNLLNASQFSDAFQNMDRRVDAASESRRKMADAAINVFNALGEVGKAAYQKKLQDDRYNSIDDADADYKEDPAWIAAKEEYARTGNSNTLNAVQSAFDARKRAAYEKRKQELEKIKMKLAERKVNQGMYDQAYSDWETNNKKLGLLNPSSATYDLDKLNLENEINKNKIAMQRYGTELNPSWTMPEYKTAATAPATTEVGEAVTESTSETAPTETKQKATYNEVETLISKFNADHKKKYSYKLKDIEPIKTKLDQLHENTKEYDDLYSKYKELEDNAAEKKQKIIKIYEPTSYNDKIYAEYDYNTSTGERKATKKHFKYDSKEIQDYLNSQKKGK